MDPAKKCLILEIVEQCLDAGAKLPPGMSLGIGLNEAAGHLGLAVYLGGMTVFEKAVAWDTPEQLGTLFAGLPSVLRQIVAAAPKANRMAVEAAEFRPGFSEN